MVLVPFGAVWPFETLLISRRSVSALDGLNHEERSALADILRQITIRYDNLFLVLRFPTPWASTSVQPMEAPILNFTSTRTSIRPLLRSATVRNIMVGYELLATAAWREYHS